ncbi:MAG: radical SAM protein [Deltaproteobacteria bacterium]|nr:radical SAM protein [Deltaproteobacteria bacterium]
MAKGERPLRLWFVSLGCPKNLVDSERVLSLLECLGAVRARSPQEADLAVVNTCAFLKEAEEEAISEIMGLRAAIGPKARLLVLGCLASRHGALPDLPEADLVVPRERYPELPGLIRGLVKERFPEGRKAPRPRDIPGLPGIDPARPSADPAESTRRGLRFEDWERAPGYPFWQKYLKISEGCDHRCAYCVIPLIRGKLVTRPLDALVREAGRLSGNGCLELTLVAQDLTSYSWEGKGLLELAEGLSKINGLRWIRLMYCYPERLTKGLLRGLSELPKVVPYLDVPFQHASKKILKSMGRGTLNPRKTLDLIRDNWPEAALRTTLMTGFPGEDDSDFQELADFLGEARFQHAGFFKFSPEEGARAALFPDQVPQFLKERRRRRLLSIQRGITQSINMGRVGQLVELLSEGTLEEEEGEGQGQGKAQGKPRQRARRKARAIIARAPFQAPEVDGQVVLPDGAPGPGNMFKARITLALGHDLLARV